MNAISVCQSGDWSTDIDGSKMINPNNFSDLLPVAPSRGTYFLSEMSQHGVETLLKGFFLSLCLYK